MKSQVGKTELLLNIMNYKLEKFWNNITNVSWLVSVTMNYKLEKFWNWIKRVSN